MKRRLNVILCILIGVQDTSIPEFPATATVLGQMNAREVDTVLQHLGLQPAHGTILAAKTKMLRAHIGLREVAQAAP